MTWQSIREILISNFAKPMTMQDYFDQVIKFRLGNDETPAEAGMRLWQLIEKKIRSQICPKMLQLDLQYLFYLNATTKYVAN